MTFDEHINFIRRVLNLKWYHSIVDNTSNIDIIKYNEAKSLLKILKKNVFTNKFGTLAIRSNTGFITTTRGKRDNELCQVYSVDPINRNLVVSSKASMNAPFLWKIFNTHLNCKYILHAHKQINNYSTHEYVFPGTLEEDSVLIHNAFNIKHHGYYALFNSIKELYGWINTHHKTH